MYSWFSLSPARSHFIDFTIWDNAIKKTYYSLSEHRDSVSLMIDSYPITFSNLKNCTHDGHFYSDVSCETFTENITKSVKEAIFLAKHLQSIEHSIDRNFALLLYSYTITDTHKDDKKILGNKTYPSHYQFTKSITDRFWNNLYFISNQEDNYFEVIKSKK